MQRYQVIDDSLSAHCCFEATVVDTNKPDIINGKHYRDYKGRLHYESVCECFDREQAELICNALNQPKEKL